MTRSWLLTYEARPVNLNAERQGNRYGRAAFVAEWRSAFRLLALEQHIPPLAACTATVQPVYPNRRRLPDVAACAPSFKAALDGIVDAGVLPDDTPEYFHAVTFLPPRVEAGRLPALEVTITETVSEPKYDANMSTEIVPRPDIYACGCVMTFALAAGVRTGTLAPCRPTCPVVAAVTGYAADAEVPLGYRTS